MGSWWSRCRCCDTDEEIADSRNAVNNETLLLTRGISSSVDWTGNNSPEEGRRGTESLKSDFSQFVHMPKLVPATAEEEREYMVRSYSSGTLFDLQPECLLCLDVFTEIRPSALSLCACGVNKNTFHLECLLEWRRKTNKANCPICDNELFVDVTESSALPGTATSATALDLQ